VKLSDFNVVQFQSGNKHPKSEVSDFLKKWEKYVLKEHDKQNRIKSTNNNKTTRSVDHERIAI